MSKKNIYAARTAARNRVRRQIHRRQKQEGKIDQRRLAFLQRILDSCGCTRKDLAILLNCTPQSVYSIFGVYDDCSLSKAQEIVHVLGLRLKVELLITEEQTINQQTIFFNSSGVKNSICGSLPKHACCSYPSYIADCSSTARLNFLAQHIVSSKISVTQIEKGIGVSHGCLYRFFARDDMSIGRLYDIARLTRAEIIWHVGT